MKIKLAPWLVFFRLPNLPTAPGDAIAGSAIALAIAQPAVAPGSSALLTLFAAGAASFFLYLFGLADNDISGAEADRIQAPKRPIPAGEITVAQARIARVICLALAVATGAFAGLPSDWWAVAAVLVAAIVAYNRFKDRCRVFGLVAMGLCRGLSLVSGAAAMQAFVPRAVVVAESASALAPTALWLAPVYVSAPVLLAALGWIATIAAVTWLAADEHAAEAPLSRLRFLPGLAVFIPMLALGAYPRNAWLLIVLCSLCAYGVWALSVAPLGRQHTPQNRRRAVGGAIGGLLYLQAGYILAVPHVALVAVVVALFLASSVIRKFFEAVPGS